MQCSSNNPTLGELIAKVGGRINDAGYVEFGSEMAVLALVRHAVAASRDAKDAARWRWLLDQPSVSVFFGTPIRFKPFDSPREIEVRQVGRVDLPEAADAAMLAASPSEGSAGDAPESPLPCCGYVPKEAGHPVMWNEWNKVVQCHNCGEVWTPASPAGTAVPGMTQEKN